MKIHMNVNNTQDWSRDYFIYLVDDYAPHYLDSSFLILTYPKIRTEIHQFSPPFYDKN